MPDQVSVTITSSTDGPKTFRHEENEKMEPISLLLAMSTGMVAGALYFAGLWWTVRLLPLLRRPVLHAFISFCFRLAALLSIFIAVMQSDWRKMLLCLAGFALAGLLLASRHPGRVCSLPKLRSI
jgi:F1F0 ATPase subunit 2